MECFGILQFFFPFIFYLLEAHGDFSLIFIVEIWLSYWRLIQFNWVTQSCPNPRTPWTAAHQTSLSITNSQSLHKPMTIESVMTSNHLILCRPLLLHIQTFPVLGSFQMSQFVALGGQSIGVSASAAVLPMNIEDRFPLGWTGWISLQSKGLSSLLQHHSRKVSILQCSGFFTVQLSFWYMTIGKTLALTRRTFVGKVMSLLFNMLFRLIITFLPRSKRLLISWLHLPMHWFWGPRK